MAAAAAAAAEPPQPSAGRRWRVVGGAERGGIVAREGQSTKSKELDRLASGAVVEEADLQGDRLCFRLLSGAGPATGWVSLRLKDKDLLMPEEAAEEAAAHHGEPAASPAAPAAPAAAGAAPPPSAAAEASATPPGGELSASAPEPTPAADGGGGDGGGGGADEGEAFWTDPARRRPADAVAGQALLEGYLLEADTSGGPQLDAPGDYKGGQLPVMPRTIGLPTYAALPEKTKKSFPERPYRKPMIRLYCFPGAADNYLLWIEFATAAPVWCEVAVYEPTGHGFRPDEPWHRSLEERAADAFRVMRPALETHAKGGVSEGAPFGLLAHGVGGQLMALVAQRMRRELALEPLVVFANDGPAPNCRTLSEEGYELLCRDVKAFYRRFQPDTMRQYERTGPGTKGAEQLLQKWSRGLRLFEEHARRCKAREEPVYHRFRCDLHVLVAKQTQDFDAMLHLVPKEMQQEYELKKSVTASPPDSGLNWTREMLCEWKAWTEEDFHAHEVETDHMTIKNSKLMQDIVFRELAGFCGMDY